MEFLFIILLVLSVPVFYILGAIDFFRTILRKKNNNNSGDSQSREQFLKQVVKEASDFLQNHPKAKAGELLSFFHHQLNQTSESSEVIISSHLEDEKPEKQQPDFWQNWYAENSINLLLYIGAFFIVASASIFVGFQWESIESQLKAILLTLLTISFFVSGFIFFQNPKVRNAGVTFSAIGSLLIPLTGLGWYNFVLKSAGFTFGSTWLLTSILALAIYVTLGVYFKNKFYGYITSLALWSLSLSFVSLGNLDAKFYILTSIISNFFILGFHLIARNYKDENLKNVFAEPMEISTNILMSSTIVVGLMIAFSGNIFFSLEVAISLFLASVYYYLFYSFTQKIWQLALSLSLFPFFLIAIFGWQNMANDPKLFYTLFILSFADLGISYTLLKNKLEKPSRVSTTIALIIAVLSFLSIIGSNYGLSNTIIATILLAASGMVSAYIHQKYELLHFSTVSLLFLIYYVNHDLIGLGDKDYLLGIIYLIFGTGSFILGYLMRNKKSLSYVFLIFSTLALVISFFFTVTNNYALLCCLLSYATILFAAAQLFKQPYLIYISNIFFSFSLFQVLRILEIPAFYHPFFYFALAAAYYLTSILYPDESEEKSPGAIYKNSALTLSLITPVFFGIQSVFTNSVLEKSALITAYLTTILYGFESTRNKNSDFRYFTSAIALTTLLWQIKLLQFSELQAYSIPLGLYFLLLAVTRKWKNDQNGEQILNAIGTGILIISSISQAFSDNGAIYALLLGVEGVAFLLAGISLNNKLFRFAGILAIVLAVFSQTYSYLFSLPRWLITGLAGVIFLAVAVFLLTKRSNNTPQDDSENNE